MVKLSRVMELTVRTDRAPGALCRVLSAIAEQGVSVVAYSAYHDLEGAFVSLVTEEVMKARQALELRGFRCTTAPVILVGAPAQVGAMVSICEDLQRAGIEIFCSYASHAGCAQTVAAHRCDVSGGRFYAVFKTSDDERAMQALSVGHVTRESQLRQAAPLFL